MVLFCLTYLCNLNDIFGSDVELLDYYYSKLIEGHVAFTLDLNKALQYHSNDENIVFSPISLTETLGLTLLGSRGQVFEQLARIMHYDKNLAIHKYSEVLHRGLGSLLDEHYNVNYNLTNVNGIFVQNDYKLHQEYVNAANTYYKSRVQSLNFQDRKNEVQNIINDWVKVHTKGKIDKIIPSELSTDTKVVFASSLYFSANWESQFDPYDTKKAPFYLNPDEKVQVEMMTQSGKFPINYDDDLKVTLLGLPYKNNEATMYILLPKESGKHALKVLATQLTAEKLASLINGSVKKRYNVSIPKMNLTSNVPVKEGLEHLGLKALFEKEADLSVLAMSDDSSPSYYKVDVDKVYSNEEYKYKVFLDTYLELEATEGVDLLRNQPYLNNPGLYADNIYHKVKLEINEKGSEGAGATVINLVGRMKTSKLVVDRPFMFFIQLNDPQLFIFCGTVYKL